MDTTPRPLNSLSRERLTYLNGLQEQLPIFIKSGWFRKRTAVEVAQYIQLIAQANESFWQSVIVDYPEVGTGNWSASMSAGVFPTPKAANASPKSLDDPPQVT
jgi:hypothetical protein